MICAYAFRASHVIRSPGRQECEVYDSNILTEHATGCIIIKARYTGSAAQTNIRARDEVNFVYIA